MRVHVWLPATVVAVAVLLLSSSIVTAAVYVNWDSPNNGPGNDWDHAYHRVADGIAAAVSGDEVWVARGRYVEHITLKAGVGLYGGFAGTETAREQRNWSLNRTVLDANYTGTSAVVTAPSGLDGTTVIDGFDIRNGSCGIRCTTGSPTISNNTITRNTGSGVSCSQSSAVISGNTIAANGGYSGAGGIACGDGSPVISNNTIVGNDGGLFSAAIICTSSAPIISNNIVAFNSAGIYARTACPRLRNNCFYNPGSFDYSGCSLDGDGIRTGVCAGMGDISADPKLVSLEHGNFHIQPDSPCRNAGWGGAAAVGAVDIDGQARMQPADGTVDIGSDESDGTLWPEADPAVVRVDGVNGDDASDGSSWDRAKKTVQAAIDAASAQIGEVWVKAGVYSERITLRPYACVYGGFAGTEAVKSDRNWATNETVLDANKGGDAVTSIGVGFRLGAIDGFTIRNGGTYCGVLCRFSSPVVSNNTITGNSIGVSCTMSSALISHNTIANNSGGGIGGSSFGYPVITGNTITANTASQGAGIQCDMSGPVPGCARITSNVITGNVTTGQGAGLRYTSYSGSSGYSYAVVTGNVIAGNTAGTCGGGIWCGGPSAVTNNTIVGNKASSAGGMACWGSPTQTAAVSNNIVAFNSSGILSSPFTVLRNNNVYNPGGTNYEDQFTAGIGDISADPRFVSVLSKNYHILPDSPCKDKGWTGAPYIGGVDMDGQPRVQPADGPIDMGADESDGTGSPLVVRVDGLNGNDANDGSTWALAKKTIQPAIDTAAITGGEVWVEAGLYPEHISLKAFVSVYGGFGGSETTRDSRDPVAGASILDPGGEWSAVTASGISSGGSYACTSIDRFTIRNGWGTSGGQFRRGGGIYCSASFLTVSNCLITGNHATYGGGVYCDQHSDVTMTNNIIVGNRGGYGGGFYSDMSSDPVMANNTFVSNTATYGGGVCCAGHATLSNNIVGFQLLGDRQGACRGLRHHAAQQ